MAARGARAASRARAAHRRAYALCRVGTRGKASGAQRRIMGPRKSQPVVCAAEEGWLISNPGFQSPRSRCCADGTVIVRNEIEPSMNAFMGRRDRRLATSCRFRPR
jgi:hypothetical protein